MLGHSLSATLVLRLAARNARVRAVGVTGAAGATGVYSEHLERIWTYPRTRAQLTTALETLVYDKTLLTAEFIDGRLAVLQGAGYREYYEAMFAGDKRALIDSAIVPGDILDAITCPVTLLHGLNDLATPWQTSVKLAERLHNSDVVLINRCGHSPALEHPQHVISKVRDLMRRVRQSS
jgi:pimeloyl-ACP methyl ester carboxylesterase